MLNTRLVSLLGLFSLAAGAASAQSVISAHAGTVHYFDGDVSINGEPLVQKHARFDEVREQEVLRTGRGRAEVLLSPGVFLRVGENSAIRMLDNRLAATRVELVSGTVIVESDARDASMKDTPVTLIHGDSQVRMAKQALFEMSTDPAEVRVFKGSAEVSGEKNHAEIKEGHKTPLQDDLQAAKFDTKTADDLYLWARDRSESISAANMASARGISSSWSDRASYQWNGGWYYNPYLSMFTYVPAAGIMTSPFGFGFYSPMTIYQAYSPVYSFAAGAAPRSSASLASPVRMATSTAGPVQLGSPMRSGAVATSRMGGGGFAGAGRVGGGLGGARGRR